MAYDGKLKFDTGVDLSGFQAGIDSLGTIADKGLSILESSFTATFDAIKSAGTGIWDFMSEAVDVGTSYEQSMSNTLALASLTKDTMVEVAGETVNAYDTLSAKAQDLGASTQYSASQVSDAFGYMALAGWDVEKQVGAIDGVLNLAAASGMDLANASDMVTDYLSAFSMEADQANYFADMLAYSSTNSNTSVEDLGEAYKNCAANMNASGQSVETTTALLSKMADQGEKGSTAGTKLTAIMRDLKNSAVDGAIAIGDTSVAVYDAKGQMRDLGDIMVDVQNATNGMSDEQRDLALGSSFTADSIAGVNLILNAGADSVVAFTEELKNCDGTAQDVANTMNDNLAGDYTSMQSAFEGLQIALSESLNDGLRTIVQNATGYLADLRQAFLDDGWHGLGTSLGDTLTKALSDNSGFITNAMGTGKTFVLSLAKSLQSNSKAIAKSVSTLLTNAIGNSATIYSTVYSVGLEMVTGIATGMAENSAEISTVLIESIDTIIESLSTNLPVLLQAGLTILQAILSGISNDTAYLVTCAITLITSLVDCLNSNVFLILDVALQILLALANALVENLPTLMGSALQLILNLAQYIVNNLPLLVDCALQIVLALANGILDNLPTLISYIPTLVISLVDAIVSNLPTLLTASVEILMALVNGIVDNVDTLLEATITILNTLISMLLDNLPMLVDVTLQLVLTLANGILDNLDQLIDASLGVLNQLIDSIIENLPLLVDCALQIVTKIAEEIANNFPKIVQKGGELIVKLVNGILDAKDKAIDGAKQIINEIWNTIQNTDWLSLGKNILSGIANGLWAGLQTVTDAISGVAGNILNSFKDYFGIASPSKLMRDEIGKFMPQGVAVGFEEETPNAIADMNRTLNSQIIGIDVDGIYSQLRNLNYSQGSVPSYSTLALAPSGYTSSDNTSEDTPNTPSTVVVENYLFKNSQKLNSMVINASVLENARSGGNSI